MFSHLGPIEFSILLIAVLVVVTVISFMVTMIVRETIRMRSIRKSVNRRLEEGIQCRKEK